MRPVLNSLEDGIDTPGPDWVTTWALALSRACSWRLEAVAERGTSGLVMRDEYARNDFWIFLHTLLKL